MRAKDHHVAVLGASQKPARYSNQAVRLLLAKGFRVTPVHPKLELIEGVPVVKHLSDITTPVDTLTLYIGPRRMEPLLDEVIQLAPKRVIFNPGTESVPLKRKLDSACIPWLYACTLVMLRVGNFITEEPVTQ